MLHPYLDNKKRTIQYVICWILYGVMQIIAMNFITTMPLEIIALDSFIHATIYGIIGILLWSVIHYGNFSILNKYQRTINYIALGVLSISIWLASGYSIIYWIYSDIYTNELLQLLPIRTLVGILIYLLIIQQFRFAVELNNCKKENEIVDNTIEEIGAKKNESIETIERIAVKSGTKIQVILIPEIIYLQADGDYVQIVTSTGKYLKEQTMKYFEEHLPENQFVRVHRSTIVNVEMISRIELYEKQNQILILKNGQQIKTSTAGYKALRGALKL